MKIIKLSKGQETIIDDDDFERVSKYKWHAAFSGIRYYAARTIKVNRKTKRIYLHHFILNTKSLVDHKNGNSLDNRKENLEESNYSKNGRNRHKIRNKTGFVGVTYKPKINKFYASITINNRVVHLGNFETAVEAAKIRDLKATELFGNNIQLNFPD